VDVLTAAWVAAGRPLAPSRAQPGRCARCGQVGVLTPTQDAVSGSFTGWDGWAHLAEPGLCPPCAWAYRCPVLRQQPTWVTAQPPAISHPTLPALAALLAGPLPAGAATAVPLRPGRKHVLPSARWGMITTDDAVLPWTAGDAHRLKVMQHLRAAGFGTRMLAAHAPAFGVLRRLPPTRRAEAMDDWQALRAWRDRPPWLHLGLRLTMPPAAPA
jgi:hypothetical protein